jgi:hypothetical protein
LPWRAWAHRPIVAGGRAGLRAGERAIEGHTLIISDPLRLAFMHIPKCAGSTVRNALAPFNSYRFDEYFDYPDGGRQLFDHLPLADVRTYLPEVYEKIADYESYAILREPHERFASALAQYLRSFHKMKLSRQSDALFRQRALEVLARLAIPQERRALEMMFFQKQAAFVTIDGRQIVRNLYGFDELHRLSSDLRLRHGIVVDLSERRNQARLEDSAPVRALKNLGRPLYRRILSEERTGRMRLALRTVTGNSPLRLYRQIFDDDEIRAFVDDFYAEDRALYEALGRR